MDIGQKIKTLAESKNISAKELGEKIGRTRQAIYDIYSGKVSVNVDLLEKISNALGVEIHSFFVNKNSLPNSKEELLEVINTVVQTVVKKNFIPIPTIRTLIVNIVKNTFEGKGMVFLELTYDKNKEGYYFKEVYHELLNKPSEAELNTYSKSIIGNIFSQAKDYLSTAEYATIINDYVDSKFK